MKINHLLLSVLCPLTSFLGTDSVQYSDGDGMLCIWSRTLSSGRSLHVFLRKTRTSSLLLYSSVWDESSSVVSCACTAERAVIDSYLLRCARNQASPRAPDSRFNLSAVLELSGPCETQGALDGFRSASVRRTRGLDAEESARITVRRSKRAWMIPGTLWCGSGSQAFNFTDLGVFEDTDKCCREHDHCKETISSFTFNYGVFNTNFFTLSHCDCDNRFRGCLLGVNDSMSNLVGYGYFNLLKMRCFEFAHRTQCARRTWWGMCAISELAKYAVVKEASNYTDTLPEMDQHMIHRTLTPAQRSPITHINEPSLPPLATDQHTPHGTPVEGNSHPPPQGLSACGIYHVLDSCQLQIPALQERFGIRNPDIGTLYHCNCTSRLISGLDESQLVHSLLMDFVSHSCFNLQPPEKCSDVKRCTIPQSEVSLLQRWRKQTVARRHLVDVHQGLTRMKLKGFKRRHSPIKLYRKCISMKKKLQRTRLYTKPTSLKT